MKTTVRVFLVAEAEVDIVVEHTADEDPCDLTVEDKARAVWRALCKYPSPNWEAREATEAKP